MASARHDGCIRTLADPAASRSTRNEDARFAFPTYFGMELLFSGEPIVLPVLRLLPFHLIKSDMPPAPLLCGPGGLQTAFRPAPQDLLCSFIFLWSPPVQITLHP